MYYYHLKAYRIVKMFKAIYALKEMFKRSIFLQIQVGEIFVIVRNTTNLQASITGLTYFLTLLVVLNLFR